MGLWPGVLSQVVMPVKAGAGPQRTRAVPAVQLASFPVDEMPFSASICFLA
jgi:hypothetical protein